MISVEVIWVGKTEKGFYTEALGYFQKRIAPLCQVTYQEVRAASHSSREQTQSKAKEGEAILKRTEPGDYVILLDEKGKTRTSINFAQHLQNRAERGKLIFILGGAFGVDEKVRKRANEIFSLSPLTFPHQLARIVFLEQLYRSLSINSGSGYHHE